MSPTALVTPREWSHDVNEELSGLGGLCESIHIDTHTQHVHVFCIVSRDVMFTSMISVSRDFDEDTEVDLTKLTPEETFVAIQSDGDSHGFCF